MPDAVMSFGGFTLIPMTEADLPRVVEWRSRPEVHEWYGGRPVTAEEIRAKHLDNTDPVTRSIVHLDGEPIGFLQFYEYIDEWKPAIGLRPDEEAWGLDLYLGEPHLHGQGIGTRLVRGVAERLASEHGATRVTIDPHVGNTAAIRCYEKAGFRKVRLMPSYERVRGEWKDAWLMEWRPGE
ncbi:MAG: GNAT family N-acetyltransferase [Actinomycetota bacterium]|nr:acetyltransferase [Actinomycetota bacterium]